MQEIINKNNLKYILNELLNNYLIKIYFIFY